MAVFFRVAANISRQLTNNINMKIYPQFEHELKLNKLHLLTHIRIKFNDNKYYLVPYRKMVSLDIISICDDIVNAINLANLECTHIKINLGMFPNPNGVNGLPMYKLDDNQSSSIQITQGTFNPETCTKL